MNATSAPIIGICGGGNLAHAMAGWLGAVACASIS